MVGKYYLLRALSLSLSAETILVFEWRWAKKK
jgi:hypothetical protein